MDRRIATAVVVVVLGIGTVCLGSGIRRIGHPFPGFLVSSNRIVLSIGRRGWSVEKADRILFAQVVAVAGQPLTVATDIDAYVADVAADTPVSYRFRKQADIFPAEVEVQRFGFGDFFALYATYFLTGACFALAGRWVLRRLPDLPAALPFFALCETVALALVTGGDVYGPYWFTMLYFTAHCVVPATLLHFASSFPEPLAAPRAWRRVGLGAVYAVVLGIAFVLNRIADDPSLFLPLIYTVYLFLANVLLLYLGRLVIARWTLASGSLRRGVQRALTGFLLSATVAGVIFVIYPVLNRPISPIMLVAPLALFPLFTASALRRAAEARISSSATSVRQRLSLLFLGAVETAFLAGIAVFWLSQSWQQLVADIALNQRQLALVDRSLTNTVSSEDLGGIDALVQSVAERAMVTAAAAASARNDPAAARAALEQLALSYREAGDRLLARGVWLGHLDAGLAFTLVVLGIVQAVGFMIAIRRWLIRPVERLALATSVIATGDLEHRAALDATSEFALLAESINVMAASLARIQERVEAEREQRRRAAGAARDAERRRLARELHDGTLQELSAVKFRLEGAALRSCDAQFQPIIEGMIDIIVGLRRVIDDIGAPEVSRASLQQAIGSYAYGLAETHGVVLDVALAGATHVPDWATRDVYRVAQEALANAVRHGTPSHLSVTLSAAAGGSVLQIQDDGCGFALQTVVLGTGIRAMQERAAAIGATLDIDTAPGHGTQVRLTLPPAPSRSAAHAS